MNTNNSNHSSPSGEVRWGAYYSSPSGEVRRGAYDYQTADPSLYRLLREFARTNRNSPTEAERAMWDCLRSNNLGVRFKRQHVIGEFIADFVCLEKGLVIEIDGGYHNLPEQVISDEYRTQWLNAHGFDVLRFDNEEVLSDIDNVIERIESYIDS